MYTDAYLEANPTLKTAKEMVDRVMGALISQHPNPNWDLVNFLHEFLDIHKAHTLLWETARVDLTFECRGCAKITSRVGGSPFEECPECAMERIVARAPYDECKLP